MNKEYVFFLSFLGFYNITNYVNAKFDKTEMQMNFLK